MKRKVINKLLAICLSVSMITAAMMPMTAAASELPVDKTTETTAEGVAPSQSEGATEAATTAGVTLYKVKVVLPNITSATKVKTLSVKQNGKDYTYDSSKLTTDAKGVLYLKLPANAASQTTAITVNDVKFSGTVKTNDDNVLSGETKTTETADSKKESEKTGTTTAATEVPETEAVTKAIETESETELQETDAQTEEVKNVLPETEESNVAVPKETETVAPETKAPETKAPETKAPETTDNKKEDVQKAELVVEKIESFGNLIYGSDVTAQPIKITNKGNAATKIKSVEVLDKNAFIVTPDKTSVGGIDIGVKGENKGYTLKPNTRSKVSGGTYHTTVKVTYEGGETVSNDVSFTLTKRELTVKSFNIPEYTYNGKKEVTVKDVVLNGVVPGDDIKATAVGTLDSANAGPKTGFSSVKYVWTDINSLLDNYTFVEKSVATNFKINPVELKLSGTVNDKEYDGKIAATGKYTLSPADEADKTIFNAEHGSTLKEKVTYEFTNAKAGIDKNAVINIDLGNKNYKADSLKVKATIEQVKNPADNKKGVKEPKVTKLTYNTLEFEAVGGQEYKLTGGKYGKDGSDWSTTNSFKDLTAKTEYNVVTRLEETTNYLVGETEVTKTQTTLRNPIKASAQNNKITGVSASYGRGATLKFTAAGAITNSSDNSLDDERYTPIKWTSYVNGVWNNNEITSQSGSFVVNNIGTYNLAVTFMKQTYNGTTWVDDQTVTDSKTVSFRVVTAGTGSVNAPKATTTTTTKTGVKTGDYNPIILLAVLLVISGGTVIVLVLTKKRKKNRN